MLVIALEGIGFTAFYRLVMPTDVFHLELDLLSSLLPSDPRCCFTPPGSIFMLTDCNCGSKEFMSLVKNDAFSSFVGTNLISTFV